MFTQPQQLYGRAVSEPSMKGYLTTEEHKWSLWYLMFLKEKKFGRIKGRGWNDGIPKCDYTTEEEMTSPTVTTESLLIYCLIDTKENIYVATCDIPGYFVQSETKGKFHMKLEGIMDDILLKIDPHDYKKWLVCDIYKIIIWDHSSSITIMEKL